MKRPLVSRTTLVSLLLTHRRGFQANAFIVPLSLTSTSKVRTDAPRDRITEISISARETENDIESSGLTNGPNPEQSSFSKLPNLKDRMWVREALEDLTAAEFACNLAPLEKEQDGKKRDKVDFENLLAKLEKRIEDMCVKSTYGDTDDACIVSYPLNESTYSNAFPKPDDECWSLLENYGKGSVTYTDEQRSALVL